jgi:hypothetical protein
VAPVERRDGQARRAISLSAPLVLEPRVSFFLDALEAARLPEGWCTSTPVAPSVDREAKLGGPALPAFCMPHASRRVGVAVQQTAGAKGRLQRGERPRAAAGFCLPWKLGRAGWEDNFASHARALVHDVCRGPEALLAVFADCRL